MGTPFKAPLCNAPYRCMNLFQGLALRPKTSKGLDVRPQIRDDCSLTVSG